MKVFGARVWPAELNGCIPAGCTQVLLNLPSNIDLLSKQRRICAPREFRGSSEFLVAFERSDGLARVSP